MNAIIQSGWAWAALALLSLLMAPVTAAELPFKADELKRFIADSVPFLEWARTNHQEIMLERLTRQPKSITEFPEAVRFLQDRKWQPERFAYVFNHVIVASKRLGMGKGAGELLARLEETKVTVEKDRTQSEAEKARTLAIVAEAQREVARTDRAFAELPAEEVRLMWLHRAELRQALEGRLPLRERVLPNPSRKP